jgi:transcriptional regulator with XRE-family HTH domain
MDFSKRLRSLRMGKGLKQSELARALNVGKSTISAYEGGKTKPSIDIAILIADYFKVSLDYLFCRTEYPNTLVTDDVQELASIVENDRLGLVKDFAELISGYDITKKF